MVGGGGVGGVYCMLLSPLPLLLLQPDARQRNISASASASSRGSASSRSSFGAASNTLIGVERELIWRSEVLLPAGGVCGTPPARLSSPRLPFGADYDSITTLIM